MKNKFIASLFIYLFLVQSSFSQILEPVSWEFKIDSSELNSSGSVYRDRVHMTIVEKFGSKSGEQVGIEKKVVDSLISYNKLESKISCVDLPCSENWASPKYLNLDALPDEGFDFVQVTSQFQNWLGVSFDSKNSFIRKSRYVNAFLEVYRVHKAYLKHLIPHSNHSFLQI